MIDADPAASRDPLTRDRIVDRAMDLARDVGMAGVSMRRLGRALGVQPMSLYYHVPSRAALMVLMAARSVSSLPEPDPGRPWNEQLVELLLHTYQAGLDDPALFPVLASESLGKPAVAVLAHQPKFASSSLMEKVLALLERADVPGADRLPACRGLIGLVVGFLVGQVDELSPAPGREASTPADRALRTSSVTSTSVAVQPERPAESLRFSLEVFIGGLQSRRPVGRSAGAEFSISDEPGRVEKTVR